MVKQAIQHVGSLALGGADRQDAEVAVLVGQMAVELRTRFAAVVQIDVAARTRTIAGLEELPIRGGRGAVAPEQGMWMLSMPVGDAGLRQLVGLRPGMEDPLPGDFLRVTPFEAAAIRFAPRLVASARTPASIAGMLRRRFLGADVREAIGKPGPGMHLHQEIGHLDQRVHVGQFPFQLLGGGRHIAGQGSDDELSRLKPDAFELAIAGAIGEPLQVEVERLTSLAKIGDGITAERQARVHRLLSRRQRPASASVVRPWAGRRDCPQPRCRRSATAPEGRPMSRSRTVGDPAWRP